MWTSIVSAVFVKGHGSGANIKVVDDTERLILTVNAIWRVREFDKHLRPCYERQLVGNESGRYGSIVGTQ